MRCNLVLFKFSLVPCVLLALLLPTIVALPLSRREVALEKANHGQDPIKGTAPLNEGRCRRRRRSSCSSRSISISRRRRSISCSRSFSYCSSSSLVLCDFERVGAHCKSRPREFECRDRKSCKKIAPCKKRTEYKKHCGKRKNRWD